MKIRKIRFKNLNSLVGEWEIDLTHAAFTSSGIFAITGPTGAGKTTILDAICLALYRQTPRLGKITITDNEVMSRQTNECFAEVIFETKSGRFRCSWGQQRTRARKNSDGKLKQKHEIVNDETEEILESQVTAVVERVEEITGLNFDRFTRSILLAQGRFDEFLQAKASERSPILEQLTGTEIYSQISIKVQKRQSEEQKKLEILKAEMKGTVTLTPEEEQQFRLELTTKKQDETRLVAESAETVKAIAWIKYITTINTDIDNLHQESNSLQSALDAFTPEREKLRQSEKAASLDAPYATLTGHRNQRDTEQAALKTAEENLPALTAFAEKAAEKLTAAEKQHAAAKDEKKKEEPRIKEIRLLDVKLNEQQKAILEAETNWRNDATKIESAQKLLKQETQNKVNTEQELKQVADYFAAHAQDEWLISELTGVEVLLGNLAKQRESVEKATAQGDTAAANLEEAITAFGKCQKQGVARKQKLEDATKKTLQTKATLRNLLGDRLLREYRTEKDTLLREMALRKTIASLEEQRAQLEDGKQCPLCGATEHPFAAGNVPSLDETDEQIKSLDNLIDQADEYEVAIKKLEGAESAANAKLAEQEKQETKAESEKKSAEKALVAAKASQEKLASDFATLKLLVLTKLQPLGIAEIPDADVSSLLESLKSRRDAWQSHTAKRAEVDSKIATIDSELKRLEAVIKTQSDALAAQQKRLNELQVEYRSEGEKRKELYGDKNPDTEEERLNTAFANSEEAEKTARNLRDEHKQNLSTAETQIESLKQRITELTTSLNDSESQFSAALASAGFADEKQFVNARLNETEHARLSAIEKTLEARESGLQARQKDCAARLQEATSLKVTEQTLDELEPQLQVAEAAHERLRNEIASIDAKLHDHAAAQETRKNQQTAIAAQEKEWQRWSNLDKLIGHSEGKTYRNFAQGLTFEIMINHANQQLKNITSRYQLLRDSEQPLELCVRDGEQDGEIRPTKNLSGGESFMVSLALALGLSHMASENVRVDSLFLDEGFGTLDAKTLDDALDALTGLQRSGKLIGVISHVDALKERIDTQIKVEPYTGGRSHLSGPGCTKIPPHILNISSKRG